EAGPAGERRGRTGRARDTMGPMTPPPSGASPSGIEAHLPDARVFPPPAAEAVGAPRWHVSSREEYRRLHARSIEDPEGCWGEAASELHWFQPWDRVCDFTPPDARWFVNGKTNLCYNCVDRHVEQDRGNDIAIRWEGEPIGPDGRPE